MAKCLNCGRKLHLWNWKPNCPDCGVNLVYFKSNEILLDESEKAETEHALFQPKVDRAKAATIGTKISIVRMVFTVLPVVTLLIPFCTVSNAEGSKKIGLIELIGFLTKADFASIFGKALSGNLASISLLLLLVSAAFFLVNLINLVTSLGKHGKGRTITLYGIMSGCGALSAVLFAIGKDVSALSENYISGKLFIGAYVYIAFLIFIFALNFKILKDGIEFKYTPCLIGGLPKDEYFSYVEQGLTKEEIRRKMLVALTDLQINAELERKAQEQNEMSKEDV